MAELRVCALFSLLIVALAGCASTEELFAEYDDKFCAVAEFPNKKFVWEPVVYFETDSAELSELAISKIKANISTLRKLTEYKISLKGFADPQGASDYNKILSSKRVDSVSRAFIEELGIAEERIVSLSFGEEQSTTGDHETPVEIDRRVEMLLLNPDTTVVIDQPLVRAGRI